jgi:hypothetical protein
MIILRVLDDLTPSCPMYDQVRHHLTVSQDLEGYLIVVEEDDLCRDLALPELASPWTDIPWEGVTRYAGYYHGVVLTNNEFGIEIIIPTSLHIPEAIRQSLDYHL